MKSTQNLIKSDVSTKTLQFGEVQGGGYDTGFHVKSGGFHEIERPLARNCNPMFSHLSLYDTACNRSLGKRVSGK